ncbi:MAG: transposase [Simplicispira sp.]|nr:transposase [Simplicispira sp.]
MKAFDLPPLSRTSVMAAKSVNLENDGHEKMQIHRRADHRLHQAGRGGLPIKELCRKGGFSDATFYKWRAKAAWTYRCAAAA